MGDYANLPKPPIIIQSSQPPAPPQPPSSHRSSMPVLYYGLGVVATAAIVLAIYNLIIVRWCANQYRRSRDANPLFGRLRNDAATMLPPSSPISGATSTISLTSSFRYKKGIAVGGNKLDEELECSVCLSVFEDGDEVKKLPRCNHSFHASCIDMWLHSHFDCPLCRAPVSTPLHRHTDSGLSEHSRDDLLDRARASSFV